MIRGRRGGYCYGEEEKEEQEGRVTVAHCFSLFFLVLAFHILQLQLY